MTDQLLGSCGPVQTFKYNASAKIISAKLYKEQTVRDTLRWNGLQAIASRSMSKNVPGWATTAT